jgi:cytochrome c peroxidase
MHNGVFKTLDQVVDFYDHAGGMKFIRDMRPQMAGLPFFTILPIELKLSALEKKELIAFIGALTDSSAGAKRPRYLPNFDRPFAALNSRTVGGDY